MGGSFFDLGPIVIAFALVACVARAQAEAYATGARQHDTPSPLFFVSVASKGVTEQLLVSADSK